MLQQTDINHLDFETEKRLRFFRIFDLPSILKTEPTDVLNSS